ncbi:hypothetical protein AAVH_00468 [Aphelenchoides avenae]|nr:hypothetical protein AAVH_00468 [Aphelenchus avenae]
MPEKSSEDEDSNKDMSGPNSVGTPSNGATGSDDSSQLQEPCGSAMPPPSTTTPTQLPLPLPAVSHSNGGLPGLDASMGLHWGVPSATTGTMLPGVTTSNGIGSQLPPPGQQLAGPLSATNFTPCSLPSPFPTGFPDRYQDGADTMKSHYPMYDPMSYSSYHHQYLATPHLQQFYPGYPT